jgi:putative transposase
MGDASVLEHPVRMEKTNGTVNKRRRALGGRVHLVTFTTDGRQPHFMDWDVAVDACRMLTASPVWEQSRLLAWTLMPDHWHGLVEVHPQDSLSALVARLKGRSARYLRQAHPQLGWIWARPVHHRPLEAEEELVAAARHLVLNPVRAGIARSVAEYPFWDSVWLMRNDMRAPPRGAPRARRDARSTASVGAASAAIPA